MALKNWYETFNANDCLKDHVTWNDMTNYIRHSACTDFTIYSECTTTGQAFRFTKNGTESLMYGGTTTGDDLKIQANDADTYPYLYLYGDGDIELHSSNDVLFYDDADEEFKFYDNSVDIKADRAIYIISSNTAFGWGCLDAITTGNYDTAVGYHALLSLTEGNENTAIGRLALNALTTGSYNVGVGSGALTALTTSNANIAIGREALEALQTGANNVAIGFGAGEATGVANNAMTLIGYQAGQNNTSDGLVAIGFQAGQNNTADGTVFVGYTAGRDNTSGANGTFVGKNAGLFNTTGNNNCFFGANAGRENLSGQHNIAFGYNAFDQNTTGSYNVAIGSQAGSSTNNLDSCIYIGKDAGNNNTNSSRLYISISNTEYPLIWGDFSNDVLKIGNNSDDFGLIFDVNTATVGKIYGGDDAGDDLYLYANSSDGYPLIRMLGADHCIVDLVNDKSLIITEQGTEIFRFHNTGSGSEITTAANNNDLFLNPNGSGVVKFGTYAAIVAETLQGYITIKDAAGNTRKLGVVA